MSHFTVTVRLTADRLARHSGDVSGALDEIMAPYYEGTEDERFLEFNDEEDEMRARYEKESTERIRLADGTLVLPWDERFRVPGQIGIGGGSHKVPDGFERVQVPFKETFATFEVWAKEWCGYDGADKKAGRYGYWRNPKKTWDWWQIGGRWAGTYPTKSGEKADQVRVSDIDFDAVRTTQQERATKFFREYLELLDGKEFDAFDGPRRTAMDLGLVRVVQGPVVERKTGERVVSWEGKVRGDDERRHWSDVLVEIDESTFFREYLDHFSPIATYAGLDDEGWVQPGRMGWFGCSDATPDTYKSWKRTFHDRFVAAAGPDDLLVVVDCHI
jgi:hypothetical protein